MSAVATDKPAILIRDHRLELDACRAVWAVHGQDRVGWSWHRRRSQMKLARRTPYPLPVCDGKNRTPWQLYWRCAEMSAVCSAAGKQESAQDPPSEALSLAAPPPKNCSPKTIDLQPERVHGSGEVRGWHEQGKECLDSLVGAWFDCELLTANRATVMTI
jgi:hypothetical protein